MWSATDRHVSWIRVRPSIFLLLGGLLVIVSGDEEALHEVAVETNTHSAVNEEVGGLPTVGDGLVGECENLTQMIGGRCGKSLDRARDVSEVERQFPSVREAEDYGWRASRSR